MPSLSADLSVEVTGPTGTITPGTSIRYDIAVKNNGPDPAFSIFLTDELSPLLNFNGCSSNFVV